MEDRVVTTDDIVRGGACWEGVMEWHSLRAPTETVLSVEDALSRCDSDEERAHIMEALGHYDYADGFGDNWGDGDGYGYGSVGGALAGGNGYGYGDSYGEGNYCGEGSGFGDRSSYGEGDRYGDGYGDGDSDGNGGWREVSSD